jgi:hypothetical protein
VILPLCGRQATKGTTLSALVRPVRPLPLRLTRCWSCPPFWRFPCRSSPPSWSLPSGTLYPRLACLPELLPEGWAFCPVAVFPPAWWPVVPGAAGFQTGSALLLPAPEPPMRRSMRYSGSPSLNCSSVGSGDHQPASMAPSSLERYDVSRNCPTSALGTWPFSPWQAPTQ